jgi:hypothetical protein
MLVEEQILTRAFLCSPETEVALRCLIAYYGLLACINDDLERLCNRRHLGSSRNVGR